MNKPDMELVVFVNINNIILKQAQKISACVISIHMIF